MTAVLGADNQELFLRLFAEKKLIGRFVRIPGHTRVNIKVVDDARHQVTDINFPGITVQAEKIDEVFATIDALAEGGAEVFVLSSSLPAGVAQNLGVEECAPLATAFSLGALGEMGPRLPARDVIEALADRVTTRRIAA